jgi:hypothetical protein
VVEQDAVGMLDDESIVLRIRGCIPEKYSRWSDNKLMMFVYGLWKFENGGSNGNEGSRSQCLRDLVDYR